MGSSVVLTRPDSVDPTRLIESLHTFFLDLCASELKQLNDIVLDIN